MWWAQISSGYFFTVFFFLHQVLLFLLSSRINVSCNSTLCLSFHVPSPFVLIWTRDRSSDATRPTPWEQAGRREWKQCVGGEEGGGRRRKASCKQTASWSCNVNARLSNRSQYGNFKRLFICFVLKNCELKFCEQFYEKAPLPATSFVI